MPEDIEKLIREVYRKYKRTLVSDAHPNEEMLVCFFEGRLSDDEAEGIKKHFLSCDSCAEAFATVTMLPENQEMEVPKGLLEKAKNIVSLPGALFEIAVRIKDQAYELLHTTGDVLVGQELMPAPLLRSRNIKDFKDEIVILKDYNGIRVEVKIEKKADSFFSVSVFAKEIQTQRIVKDMRATLIKEDMELESYITDSGRIIFDHVMLGKYAIELAGAEDKITTINIEVNI